MITSKVIMTIIITEYEILLEERHHPWHWETNKTYSRLLINICQRLYETWLKQIVNSAALAHLPLIYNLD